MHPFPSDPSSAFGLGDTLGGMPLAPGLTSDALAGLPLAPGLTPSFTNDPYMDALKTLFLLPTLTPEVRKDLIYL